MKISKLQYDYLTEVGEILHKAKSGRLILKLYEHTTIKTGDTIIDSQGKKLGTINELIGRVNSPYASVIMLRDDFKTKTGEKVFRFIAKNTKKYFPKGFKKRYTNTQKKRRNIQ
jgi:rRNA processing protein Gar1